MFRRMLLASLLVVLSTSAIAQEKAKKKEPPARPTPTAADYVYGQDSERQKFDFWQARSDKPTPLVLLIHGGGWMGGDKTGYGTSAIQPFLDAGISVAALNSRFRSESIGKGRVLSSSLCCRQARWTNSESVLHPRIWALRC